MSALTELLAVETRLGPVDLQANIATVYIVSRYLIHRTVYRTAYRTVTYSVLSKFITAIRRTHVLEYGNLRTEFITVIPTRILAEVSTFTITQPEEVAPQQTPQQERRGTQPTPLRGTPIPTPMPI